MTLDQIIVLDKIVETGSFRAASESLHRAQSAVSYSVKQLELEIGLKLFDRTTYRPKLTAEGEAFLREAKAVLTRFKELGTFVRTLSSQIEPKVRISICALADLGPVGKILKIFSKKFKDTQIELSLEILSGEEMVTNDLVDMGLVEGPVDDALFDVFPVMHVEMPLVVSGDHPLLKIKGQLRRNQIHVYPQIVVKSTLGISNKSAGVFEEGPRWYVSDFQSKKQLLLNGLGVGRMPKHLILKELKAGKLKVLKVEGMETLKVELQLIKRPHQNMGPASSWLWDSFKLCNN